MQTLEMPTGLPRFGLLSQQVNIPIDKLNAQLLQVAKQPGTPRPVANAIFASIWLFNVETFRSQEEEFMLTGTFDASKDDNRCMMSGLIAEGESVVFAIMQQGIVEFGLTLADVKASLDSLRTAFFCEHGPKNSEQTNRMIAGLFDVTSA